MATEPLDKERFLEYLQLVAIPDLFSQDQQVLLKDPDKLNRILADLQICYIFMKTNLDNIEGDDFNAIYNDMVLDGYNSLQLTSAEKEILPTK